MGNTKSQGLVVIVGAGVAGFAAAIELAERGVPVLLVEASATVGGKVNGWHDAEGRSLEHGMHGWWVEYRNFRDLLARIGADRDLTDLVGPFHAIHRTGEVDSLSFSTGPSPVHVVRMLRRLRTLGLRQKLSSVWAGLSVLAFDPDVDMHRLDSIDARSWLRKKGVSAAAVELIYEPTLRSNLFLPLEETSAASAVNALLRGLRRSDSWRFAWLNGNAGDRLWEPMEAYLLECGGELRRSARVVSIKIDPNGSCTTIDMVRADGVSETIRAADLVLAVDIESCKTLVMDSLNSIPFFNRVLNLDTTDVLVTRTWFDGPAEMGLPHAVLLGYEIVDAAIDVSSIQAESAWGDRVLVETQSYLPDPWMRATDEEITRATVSDLQSAFPNLRNAKPSHTQVIRHEGVFTAFRPGFEASRPTVCTPVPNVYLAGDWVRGPLPVMFMENAVVTGRAAASAVLARRGRHDRVPILASPAADFPVRLVAATGKPLKAIRALFHRAFGYHPIEH